jgi:hypothetical protein
MRQGRLVNQALVKRVELERLFLDFKKQYPDLASSLLIDNFDLSGEIILREIEIEKLQDIVKVFQKESPMLDIAECYAN